MVGIMKWLSPVMAVVMLVGWSNLMVRADDAPKSAVGSISGTITDKDGKPAANVTVNLWPPAAAKAPKKAAEVGSRTLGAKDKGAKKVAPAALMTTTTAQDGTYSFAAVAVGDYLIDAGNKKDSNGYAKQSISVKAGDSLTVPLQLQVGKAKAPKA